MNRCFGLGWAFLLGGVLLSACGGDESGGAADDDANSGAGGSSGSGGNATGGTDPSGGVGGSGGSSGGSGGSATGGTAGSSGAPPNTDFPTGFGPAEPLVTELTFPVRLGIREGYLYFTEMGLEDGTMSRIARRTPSGEVETLFAGNKIAAMHLDAEELFFVERGTSTVYRVNYTTLEREVFITTTMTVADVETEGDRVWITEYTSTPSAMTRVTVYDRSGTLLATPVPETPTRLFAYMAVGAGNVYISEVGVGALFKVPPSGSGGVTVSDVRPNHLAVDDMFVYFTSQTDGRVLRQLHTLDERPEQLASGQTMPFAVAVDAGGAYWTNGGPDCESGTGGSVYGVALAAGTPVPVATGERCPQAIITDGEYVYWTREAVEAPADDSIVRARKMF
ncbi:MAG TPA: hypothetical protein VFZ53_02185 [Polyangiaceae bacterium]